MVAGIRPGSLGYYHGERGAIGRSRMPLARSRRVKYFAIDPVAITNDIHAYDAITAVIETKGCWNSQLLTAIKTQLHDHYLMRLGAPLGIGRMV
jgi:hypothetical protein